VGFTHGYSDLATSWQKNNYLYRNLATSWFFFQIDIIVIDLIAIKRSPPSVNPSIITAFPIFFFVVIMVFSRLFLAFSPILPRQFEPVFLIYCQLFP
jgi:hypothetical protein